MADCCQAIDAHFEVSKAAGQLQEFEQHGPPRETRMLVEGLLEAGIQGMTVLDIGAGLGIIADQLLEAGAQHATLVDISTAYIEAARRRLSDRGFVQRVKLRQGDASTLGDAIAAADVVTLDKVICCYPDMPALVRQTVNRARRYYAATYPRARWLVRLSFWYENTRRKLRGNSFRTFVHSPQHIESLLKQAGFLPRTVRQTFFWRIVLFERSGKDAAETSR